MRLYGLSCVLAFGLTGDTAILVLRLDFVGVLAIGVGAGRSFACRSLKNDACFAGFTTELISCLWLVGMVAVGIGASIQLVNIAND